MKSEPTLGLCSQCGHHQLFEKIQVRHGLHLFLSIVSCGLWLVSWAAYFVGYLIRPWRCKQCGCSRPVFPPQNGSLINYALAFLNFAHRNF